jgi:hypothetical protein
MSAAPTWTIASVRDALASKKTSARELTKDFYAQIERRNPELNAFLALCPERAYAQADRVDAALGKGHPLPPLAGVPVAIKDVISTQGVRTTCGSKILETYTPPYDATAIERLARPTATNLPWVAPTRTQHTVQYGTRQLWIEFQAAQAAEQQQSWRLAWRSFRSVRTLEARLDSQARTAAFQQ